jgi:hypothetical protein
MPPRGRSRPLFSEPWRHGRFPFTLLLLRPWRPPPAALEKLNGLTGLAESGPPAGLGKPDRRFVAFSFQLKAAREDPRGRFEEDRPGDPLERPVEPGFQGEAQASPA